MNWDSFAVSLETNIGVPQGASYFYRKTEKGSYLMYRELCQYVDAAVLVPESLNYNNGYLVAAFMYLQVAVQLEIFGRDDVIQHFNHSSLYILDEGLKYNRVFEKFLSVSLRVTLAELLPFIQFASQFFGLPLKYEIPSAFTQADDCQNVLILIFNKNRNPMKRCWGI